jgi:3'(2'), 5'-bisphosphate nucleotidase
LSRRQGDGGDSAACVRAGGQWEWGFGGARRHAAGLHASRITAGFVANSATPNLPDLLICRPELADTLLAAIAAGTAGEIGA